MTMIPQADRTLGLLAPAPDIELAEQSRRMKKEPPKFTGAVHPLAARWPLLDEEGLANLAADIKANGLSEPLMLDEEGRLVDGRNRLEACRRAGVEPRFLVLNGVSARAYIWSHNAQRRNTTSG